MSDQTYTVICANPFHKRASVTVGDEEHAVSFERDGDVAKATGLPSAVAEALLEADDAYQVPAPEEDPGFPEVDASENLSSEDADEEAQSSESVTAVDGIGPARAEDLSEAGIETVAALAEADAEMVADATDVETDTATTWIGAAKAHL